jgi:hypothetical protein
MSYLHFAVVEFSLHFGRYVFLVALVGVLHPSGHWVVRLEDMFRVQGAPTITLYRGPHFASDFLVQGQAKMKMKLNVTSLNEDTICFVY